MDRRHGNGEHEKRRALVVRIGEFRTKRQLCDCPGDTRVAQSLTALHQAAGSSMEGMESAYSGAPPSMEIAVDAYPTCRYKGFDVYPLIYLFDPPREWHERRPDRTYRASVLICVAGEPPSAEHSRIFRLEADQWENIGTAKRAAAKMAEDIIDGFVPGSSMISE